MNAERMVLHSQDVHCSPPDLPALVVVLRDAGLLGNALPENETAFYPGDQFTRLLTFLGCRQSLKGKTIITCSG
ncbi:MAG: hypothetical protein BMS9Abin36_1886 [Gammaproteobacteria bacterium]|nr:MAG: hypothetical protein BMS9Abin36_1886 [Gammaproteobacteria bacterium]